MAYNIYFRYSGSWIDVTDYVVSIKGTLRPENIVDSLEITFSPAYLNDINDIRIKDEFKIIVDGVSRFVGSVTGMDDNRSSSIIVTVSSFSSQAIEPIVNEYIMEMSSEGLIYYLVANYLPEFEFVVPDTPTGYTFKKLTFIDKKLIDIFKLVCDTIGYTIRFDEDKKVYFEKRADNINLKTLTVGNEILTIPSWKLNTDNICNSLVLEAGTDYFGEIETFIADPGATTFKLKYIPTNTTILVNGVLYRPEIPGSTSGDYIINTGSRDVIFNVAMTGGENIVIDYNYAVPIKLRDKTQTSIDEFGLKEEKINKPYINSFKDARRYFREYLDSKSYPIPTAEGLILRYWYPEVTPNSRVRIIDTLNKRPIDRIFNITSIELDYPIAQAKINVGIDEDTFYDKQAIIMEKIKDLETNPDNSQFVQKSPIYKTKFRVKTKIEKQPSMYRLINDSFIPDHNENGMVYEETEAFVIDVFEGVVV